MRNLNHGGTWKAIKQDYYWCKKRKQFRKRMPLKTKILLFILLIVIILGFTV